MVQNGVQGERRTVLRPWEENKHISMIGNGSVLHSNRWRAWILDIQIGRSLEDNETSWSPNRDELTNQANRKNKGNF
jgi:hypothetical protein